MFRAAIMGFALLSAPALAAPAYQAEPAAKPAKAKLVVRDVMWNCAETGCSATKSASRPAIVCASLAKEVGALRSFSVNGEALAAADLEKCNARAN